MKTKTKQNKKLKLICGFVDEFWEIFNGDTKKLFFEHQQKIIQFRINSIFIPFDTMGTDITSITGNLREGWISVQFSKGYPIQKLKIFSLGSL